MTAKLKRLDQFQALNEAQKGRPRSSWGSQFHGSSFQDKMKVELGWAAQMKFRV